MTEPRSRSTLVDFDRIRIGGTLVINLLLLQVLLNIAKVLFCFRHPQWRVRISDITFDTLLFFDTFAYQYCFFFTLWTSQSWTQVQHLTLWTCKSWGMTGWRAFRKGFGDPSKQQVEKESVVHLSGNAGCLYTGLPQLHPRVSLNLSWTRRCATWLNLDFASESWTLRSAEVTSSENVILIIVCFFFSPVF